MALAQRFEEQRETVETLETLGLMMEATRAEMPRHQRRVLESIGHVLAATDSEHQLRLIETLDAASRIFVAGAGRSGLVARFFAMRLMHAGYEAFVVGEIVTPSIRKGDVLLVISGSGETEMMLSFARRARELGAHVCLLSTKPQSSIGRIAELVCQIGSPEQCRSVAGLPMGTKFELSVLVFLEAVFAQLVEESGITEDEMRARHANLE